MALFDLYIAVDWSANNAPKLGPDSIWSCVGTRGSHELRTANHRTRREAEAWLCARLGAAVTARERVLIGFDFPYGYPAGLAHHLGVDGWDGVWEFLDRQISDDELNRNNRFQLAAEVNRRLGRHAPFWGRPAHLDLPLIPARKQVSHRGPADPRGLSEWRVVEHRLQRLGRYPQSTWKLAYTGAVGSQSLVGIPVVRRLRLHETLRDVSRVWPFEVRVPDSPPRTPSIVHAEIWPSIVRFNRERGTCKDEQQVRAVVQALRRRDRDGGLGVLLAAPPEHRAVTREEGWILGVPAPGADMDLLTLPSVDREIVV